MNPAQPMEVDSLYQHELASANHDLRSKAALLAFRKLRATNRSTVEELFAGLERHPEMWAVVSKMGILDFAAALLGRNHGAHDATPVEKRRTRLSDEQKQTLKDAVLRVLAQREDGLSRVEIAAVIGDSGLAPIGIARSELSEKLRQPLHELIADEKLQALGERRLMRYRLLAARGR